MVDRGRSRHGGSTLGCLFSLVLFAAALYYGVHIGEVYLRYYRLVDAMRFQAQIAPTIKDDAVIDRRLTAAADSILGQIPRFQIDRGRVRNLPWRGAEVLSVQGRHGDAGARTDRGTA
jgi:hypothetical protein